MMINNKRGISLSNNTFGIFLNLFTIYIQTSLKDTRRSVFSVFKQVKKALWENSYIKISYIFNLN